MAKPKKELKELAEEEIGEPVEVEVKQPLDKVVPVRLSAGDWAELYKYARRLGVGPTTLARMWILERLAFVKAATPGLQLPFEIPSPGTWTPPLPPGAMLIVSPSTSVPQLPKRATLTQFMTALMNLFPYEDRSVLEQLVKEGAIMLPADAKTPEDVKAFFTTGGAACEASEVFFRGIAKCMGVEIVEEAKSEDPRSEVKR